MIPPLSCKQDLNILEFLEFLHNFYVHRTIRHWNVQSLCANKTSRYCSFLDLLLEFSCLSKNDLKHRNKPSQALWFRQSWGICPAQSTRITAPQRLNRAVVICGCSSRVLVIRGRFRQTDSLLKWHAKGGRALDIQASSSQQKAQSKLLKLNGAPETIN